jgi:lipopolysaccharide transport system permease protein
MPQTASVGRSACGMLQTIFRYRKLLAAITRVEIAKRYSGAAFGKIWLVLFPGLLLANYLFIYLVIFKMRAAFAEYSNFDYVLYIFCGLVPFLGISEALNTGATVLKQNLHLVKNVMLPIELIPVRSILVSMVVQLCSLGILLTLLAFHGNISVHVLWLPVVFLLQMLMLLGLVLVVSLLTLLLPDFSYVISLSLVFLMFVSPIGFKPEMVPAGFRFVVYLNPLHYLIELYRCSLLWGKLPSPLVASVCVAFCLGSFILGSALFQRFKGVLVDYE